MKTQQENDAGGLTRPLTIRQHIDAKLDEVDRFLLRHYLNVTCWTIADLNTEIVWRTAIPELAYRNSFLLHGLLACAAIHLSSEQLHPIEYIVRATNHQKLAMPIFRAAISNPTTDNCHAVLAFAHLLVIYSFAAENEDERLFLADGDSLELVPSWLFFIRSGCSMLCSVWETILSGPVQNLANSWDIPILVLEDYRTPLIGHLLSAIPPQDSHYAWSLEECHIYHEATTELGLAFGASVVGELCTTWDVLRLWPLRVSTDYFRLLNSHHPGALILLAHYCLLIRKLDAKWYLKGRAKRLLSAITKFLDSRWQCYIRVPLSDIM
jgi:hypothetical protein